MTRSPNLIHDIALCAIRAVLEPRPDLLGAPRTTPLRWTAPAVIIPVLQPAS